MRLKRARRLVTILAGAACAGLLAFAGPASAANATYPDGGSGFDEGAEGWSAGGASCTPAELLCTSEAVYDTTTGKPPGSIAARTTVTLNLAGLFKGTATWVSPQFTIPVEAVTDADVHLDRAFDPGGLVDVEPKGTYTVTLADISAGRSTVALSGELAGMTPFGSDAAPVAVVAGHTYRLSIEAVTAQSTLALSLLSGTTNLRFDNVGLTVSSTGGGGSGGNGNGKGVGGGGEGKRESSLSDTQLLALLRSGGAGPIVLKGSRLLVKVNCPPEVRHACRIAAQGMLNRRRPATGKRMVKLGKGQARRVVLRVKPKARPKLAKRRRLLVREKVHAGKAKATFYRQRRLIRQG
ncbi:MAG TPA: hypothetical protein VF085_07620 [Solirubrobacterales bacterium]